MKVKDFIQSKEAGGSDGSYHFYMELKASANMSDKQMVLLVDEPGVSLHARAQEDVLKVFEDIKDKIQIIYTTHSPHLVEINKLAQGSCCSA